MIKKIVCIFVCTLLCVTVSAVTGTELVDKNGGPQLITENDVYNRDMWDVQFQYDVGGDTASLYLAGVAYDGTNFYVPEWNSNKIYRFDHDGLYLDTFTITGVPNLVDLAYDGTYVYGTSTTGTTLYKMDMVAHTLISSTPLPQASYNVAYDADADSGNGGFWIGQWQTHLTLVDRSGGVLDSISPVPESMFGIAWDPITEIEGYNGPILWVFTGTSTGSQGIIKAIDLDTKTLISGLQHNVATDLDNGMAGGLEFTTDYETGTGTLYGIVQGTDPINDYAFGYEVCTTNNPPLTPGAPDGEDSGVVNVEYTFTATTSDPESEQIYYLFDWGDGTDSGWVGPYDSGLPGSAIHKWTAAGDYPVKVKAKDVNDAESDFSPAHTITITEPPVLEVGTIKGGLFKVTAIIKNTGNSDATGVSWSIDLNGGLIILGKTSSGTVDIPKGGQKTVQSVMILGIGTTLITVSASIPESSDAKSKSAFVIGFLII